MVATLEHGPIAFPHERWTLDSEPHPILRQPGVEILNTRRPNLVDAWVPVALLRTRDLPVDDGQLALLQEDFKAQKALGHENGQRDAIGAAILKNQDIDYGIAIHDGYHRSNLLQRNRERRALVSLTIDCSPEDLIRLRTLAAIPHEMVKPPRMVLTLGQQWGLTRWAQRDIKITQAFPMILNRKSTGARTFGSPKEADEAADFIKAACKEWGVTEVNAYQYFLTAEVTDPGIFFAIEGRRSGRELRALTFQHVQSIARKEYDGRSLANRFEEQRLVRDTVLREKGGLNNRDTQALVRAVVMADGPDEAKRIIDEGAWRSELGNRKSPDARKGEVIESTPWWRGSELVKQTEQELLDALLAGPEQFLALQHNLRLVPTQAVLYIQSAVARTQIKKSDEKKKYPGFEKT